MTLEPDEDGDAVRLRLQDARRPVRRPDQPLPRLPGRDDATTRRCSTRRAHDKERIGQLLVPQGKEIEPRRRVRPRRHRRGRQAQGDARRRLAAPARDEPIAMPPIELPGAGDGVRRSSRRPRATRTRSFTALRRLQEEDPTIDLHRDPQTGEQIVAGLIADPRRGDRRADEARASAPRSTLQPPRVPYQETIRGRPRPTAATRSRPAAAASSATATSRSSRCRTATASSSSTRSRAASIPTGFIPAVEKGVRRGDGSTAPSPATRSRACACGSSTARTTRSTPRRWRSRSPARWPCKEALEQAEPGAARADHARHRRRCPRTSVGDVIGDLNSRRGRPLGMEPKGGDDRGQGRGADGRDAQLRARPALDHRRPGRVHDGVRCATRRSRRTSRRRSREKATRRGGSRQGLAEADVTTRLARMAQIRDIQHQPGRRRLRRLRAHAAARRARRALPGRRPAPRRSASCARARAARGLDPRVRRRRARAAQHRATKAAGARLRSSALREPRREPARASCTPRATPPRRSAAATRRRRHGHERRRSRAGPRHVRAVPTNAELKMRARARGLQRLRAHAHGRRRRPLARRRRRSACARCRTGRAWSRSPSCGSCPGTATRSTCPTRRAACGATARATSCRSSTAEEQAANAAADERGALSLQRMTEFSLTSQRIRSRVSDLLRRT